MPPSSILSKKRPVMPCYSKRPVICHSPILIKRITLYCHSCRATNGGEASKTNLLRAKLQAKIVHQVRVRHIITVHIIVIIIIIIILIIIS